MQSSLKINYAPAAIDDLDEIFSYIASDNYEAAESLLDKLAERIAGLADFPNKGTILPEDEYELAARGYRYIVVHPYLVFYRVSDSAIIIHRVLHGRRDYLRELFDQLKE